MYVVLQTFKSSTSVHLLIQCNADMVSFLSPSLSLSLCMCVCARMCVCNMLYLISRSTTEVFSTCVGCGFCLESHLTLFCALWVLSWLSALDVVRWCRTYLQVTDDAERLGAAHSAGGGGWELMRPANQQVPRRRVAAAFRAHIAEFR